VQNSLTGSHLQATLIDVQSSITGPPRDVASGVIHNQDVVRAWEGHGCEQLHHVAWRIASTLSEPSDGTDKKSAEMKHNTPT
jgi:hypothetical protein